MMYKKETGRYIIRTQFEGERRDYAAILLLDVYEDWSEYHCTYRGGAIALKLIQKGSRWLCKDRRFLVDSVEQVSNEQYCRELNKIVGFRRAARTS